MSKKLRVENGDIIDDVEACSKHGQRDGRPDPDCPDCQTDS